MFEILDRDNQTDFTTRLKAITDVLNKRSIEYKIHYSPLFNPHAGRIIYSALIEQLPQAPKENINRTFYVLYYYQGASGRTKAYTAQLMAINKDEARAAFVLGKPDAIIKAIEDYPPS